MMYGYWGGGLGLFGAIIGLLFWILIIWLIVSGILWLFYGEDHPRHCHWRQYGPAFDKDPLDILKERYAKGEIDKEKFEQMKKDLEK